MPAPDRRKRGRRAARRNRLLVPITAVVGVLLIVVGLVVSQASGNDSNGGSPLASATKGLLGSVTGGASPSAKPGSPSVGTLPVDGCTSTARLKPGTSTQSITSDGVPRSFLLTVPAAATGSKPLPLVLNFHGFGQSALVQEGYTHLAATGAQKGYIVVTPLGWKYQWNFVRRAAVGPDDVSFVSHTLDLLQTRLCVDRRRVFATGISDGGDMAVTLACALPGRIAAVAPVAASVAPPSCGANPPSMLEIHGTADPIVPFGGGGSDRPAPFQGTKPQAAQARLAKYATYAGCAATTRTIPSTADSSLLAWTGCPSGKDVGLLVVRGGGHTWPGAAAKPSLGPTATDFQANEVILAFFEGHPAAAASGAGSGGGSATASPSTAPATTG